MKKAFCEPGNVAFCPPISIATALCFGGRGSTGECEFVIPRSVENGGNVLFVNRDELERAFAQGEGVLHPGDLKGAVTTVVVAMLEKLSEDMKGDAECAKASKTLKTIAKRVMKSKMKK